MIIRSTLTAAVAAALALSFAIPVHAQDTSMRAQREQRLRELRGETADDSSTKKNKKDEAQTSKSAEAPRYPNAKRKEPKITTSREGSEKLKAIVEAFNKREFAGVITQADAIVASNASPYEKGFAERLAGLAAAQNKDTNRSIAYLKAAIDGNALDNNPHFDSMSDLSAQYQVAGKNQEALAMLDKFLAESGSTDPQYSSVRASLLGLTGRSAEAIKFYSDAVAKDPNNITNVRNLAASYEAAGDTKKTYEVLNDARKRGIATGDDYKVLYSGYLVKDKNWKAGAEILDEGVAKNLLPKNEDTAKAYMVVAQNAYMDDQWNIALANYAKAAAISTNGEADLNRAKILNTQGKKAESKAAAQVALTKGVKNPAEAQRLAK